MGQVAAVASTMTKVTAQGHAHGAVQLFGHAQEGADAQELHQHVVVHQDHGEEDASKLQRASLCIPSFRSRQQAQQLLRFIGRPACVPARCGRPS